jgi:integrase
MPARILTGDRPETIPDGIESSQIRLSARTTPAHCGDLATRPPHLPVDSPTLGLTHLQLEALLTAARQSANLGDFALVCLLGLLGLRIFEATGLNIADLAGRAHAAGRWCPGHALGVRSVPGRRGRR